MRISPLDIRKQAFKGKLRGVDPEEVRIFLDVVASEYEQVLQENAMLVERLRSYEARVAEYQKMEANLRDAIVKMEQYANQSRESAEQHARRVLQEAHGRAERIVEDARERLQSLIREIEMLRGKKEIFARRFWTLIEGQIAVLQEHMTDSVEVDTLRQKIARLAAEARQAAAADLGPAREAPAPAALEARLRQEATRGAGEPMVEIPVGETLGGAFEGLAGEHRPAREDDLGARDDRPDPRGGGAFEASSAPAPRPPSAPGGFWDRPSPAGSFAGSSPPGTAPRDEAEDASRRRAVPKGLRSLLRGRQAQLPLGDRGLATAGADGEGEAAVPSVERREGFFELRADLPSRDGSAAYHRGGNGADRS